MMNYDYRIRYLSEDAPEPFAVEREFLPEAMEPTWLGLEEAKLAYFPWEKEYTPESYARVGWNDKGIHVLMYTNEPTIRCEVHDIGGDVYTDSCLEFFIAPVADDARYINCEVNPQGVFHLGIGTGRYDRTVERRVPENMNMRHSIHRGAWWAISYTIPANFLAERFGCGPRQMKEARGNFYKCGNLHILHHGMFYPYPIDKPDFHRPEYFARFVFYRD